MPHSVLFILQTPENIQPVGRCIRRQEIRNCIRLPSRATKEFHRPFNADVLNVTIVAGVRLVDVFKLANESERCFGAFHTSGKYKRSA